MNLCVINRIEYINKSSQARDLSLHTVNQVDSLKEFISSKSLLIFDFDGTIANTSGHHKMAFQMVLNEFSIRVDYSKIAGQNTYQALKYCLEEANHRLTDFHLNELVLLKQKMVRELISNDKDFLPMPGAKEFLRWSQPKFESVIASSGSRETVKLAIEKLGLSNFFKFALCSEDVKAAKPEPEIFLKAVSLAGFTRSQSVIFEDSITGIEAAKNAKIPFININQLPFTLINQELEIT